MVPLMSLLAPIALAAVVTFIASSVIHMFLGYHHGDFASVPSENEVMDALRKFNIPPGDYHMPRPAKMSDMGSPEFKEKMLKGPKVVFTVMPNGPFSMTSNLAQWFVFILILNVFVAYVASHALAAGSQYLAVFRIVGTTTFIAYALGGIPESIWYSRKWSTAFKNTFDALIYGLLAGGVYGWLWPK